MTLRIKILYIQCHHAECPYVEFCNLSIVILKVIMLNVIILKVIMLNVIILNVIMPSVIILNIIMLSVVILNVIKLSLVMLNVIMLSVFMVNVVLWRPSVTVLIFASKVGAYPSGAPCQSFNTSNIRLVWKCRKKV